MAIVYGANYGAPTLDLNFARNKSLIDTVSGLNLVTFTRASTGTYVGADGLIKTAVANEARFDHNPLTGVCNGLLIEESRTNSIRDSSNYTFTNWHYAYCQLTTNATTAPDGTNTAGLVRQTNGTSTRQFMCTSYSIPSTGSSWIASVYVKRYNYDYVIFTAGDEDSGSRGDRFGYLQGQLGFNFATKQIIMNPSTNWGGSITGFGYDELPNGWYRLWFSKASFPRANYWGISVQQLTVNGNTGINGDLPIIAGNGTSGVYVWGFQVEAGSFPTSYIPTTGSTVTRSADIMSITGTNFSRWYNNTEGTFFTNAILAFTQDAGNPFTFGGVYYTTVSVASAIRTLANSTIMGGLSSSLTSFSKTAVALKSGNFAIGRGGSITGSSSTVYTPTGTEFRINSSLGSLALINRLTYYPSRLQDFQLQQLTK